ncbi:rhomboid-like protein 14, mitochondrial [Rutidosis leptorrhynchoides]|uniref:rhomboid-like protein 14, mitochondrial n=1 Tax=Rutidosis leptorrhynchoides TaxID=125765 RepID=UPI003A9A2420
MARRNVRWPVSNGMIPLMLFQAVNEYRKLDRKPPVTAALLAANTLMYLRPDFLRHIIPSIDDVFFNAHLIVKYWDLKRFFLSAFYHLNESHLAYNMMSLLWKGIQLESTMGSNEFASMIAALLGLSQGITLLLAKSLMFFDYEDAYYHEYAAGFSGVLFAMKVVLNAQSDSYSNVHGFTVPTKHAAWAELVLIQMLVPNVSFLGHLGGILAGLVYLRLKALYRGPSPLTKLVKGLTSLMSWPLRSVLRFWQPSQQRTFGRGRTGVNGVSTSGVWSCRACTFDNSGWLTACEVCGTARSDDGLASFRVSNEIPHDEIRQRRIQRFGR